MIIAARMGELCRGSQGFPWKGQNGFVALIKTVIEGTDPLNTVYYSCWSSDCASLLFMISCTVNLGAVEGHKEKEPHICLSLEEF